MGHYNISGTTAVKLAESVEAAIDAGHLPPGQRLPAIRALAQQVRVNRNTVTAAYQRLAAAGLVISDGRRGTRVAAAAPAIVPALGVTAPASHVRRLDVGGPDPQFLPALGPVLSELMPPLHTYGEETNLPELLDIGHAYFGGDGYTQGRLAVVGGALDGLERLLRIHLRPGDRVGMEDPGFLAGVALVRSMGFTPVPIAMDEDGPLPDAFASALRQHVRAVILTPRAQNPTGAVISASRANALRQQLDEHPEILVIEDDHAGPIADAPAVSVAYNRAGSWAILRSVAKFLGPDLRLGFVLGDKVTVARLEGQMALGVRWVSHILQHTVVRLWNDPATHELMASAARTYADRRNALLDALAEREIPAVGPSGLNVWVPVPSEISIVQALLEKGWAVAPGEGFRINSAPGIRIMTARLELVEVDRFADDLAQALSPIRFVSQV